MLRAFRGYHYLSSNEPPRSKLRGIYKKEDDDYMSNLRFLKLFPLRELQVKMPVNEGLFY
jgi:hypothetical protein